MITVLTRKVRNLGSVTNEGSVDHYGWAQLSQAWISPSSNRKLVYRCYLLMIVYLYFNYQVLTWFFILFLDINLLFAGRVTRLYKEAAIAGVGFDKFKFQRRKSWAKWQCISFQFKRNETCQNRSMTACSKCLLLSTRPHDHVWECLAIHISISMDIRKID